MEEEDSLLLFGQGKGRGEVFSQLKHTGLLQPEISRCVPGTCIQTPVWQGGDLHCSRGGVGRWHDPNRQETQFGGSRTVDPYRLQTPVFGE